MTSLDLGYGVWFVIGGYLLALLAIGIFGYFKKSKNEDEMREYYLAGGQLGYFVLFMTIFSTFFSGDAYRRGFSALMWAPGVIMAQVGMCFAAPRLRRLAQERNYISPLDYVQDVHHSTLLLVLCLTCMLIPTAIYVLAQCKSMADFVEGLTGGKIPGIWGAIFLGVIMLIYENLGGMRSVAWTDVLQGVILLSGFVFLYIVSYSEFGGLWNIAEEIRKKDPELTAVPSSVSQLQWLSFCLLMTSTGCWPFVLQRVFAAKDENRLRVSTAFMSCAPYIATIPPLVIGLMGIVKFQLSAQDSDQVFSLFMKDQLDKGPVSYWIVSFLMAAVIASIMSTADSALMAVSSLVCLDIVKRFLKKDATRKQLLVVARVTSVIVLLASILLVTLLHMNLKNLLKLQYNILIQATPTYYLGIYFTIKANSLIVGIIGGIATTIVLLLTGLQTALDPGIVGIIVNLLSVGGMQVYFWKKNKAQDQTSGVNLLEKEGEVKVEDQKTMEVELMTEEEIKNEVGSTGVVEGSQQVKSTKEPSDYLIFKLAAPIILLLTVPFYRSPGAQDFFVIGFPLWAFVSLCACVMMSLMVIIACWKLWNCKPQ